MPGRILTIPGFIYPVAVQASLTKFPVDAFNTGLASIASALGLTHLFDPAYLAGGVVPDLETTGSFAGVNIAAGATINGQASVACTVSPASRLTSSFNKTETSFSVLFAVNQTSADLAVSGNKAIMGANEANFYVLAGGTGISFGLNGASLGTISGATAGVPTIGLFSYDDATKGWSIRTGADAVAASGTAAASPANGMPWTIGGLNTGRPFQGQIGNVIICSKALHLAANDAARQQMLALARAKYGL